MDSRVYKELFFFQWFMEPDIPLALNLAVLAYYFGIFTIRLLFNPVFTI